MYLGPSKFLYVILVTKKTFILSWNGHSSNCSRVDVPVTFIFIVERSVEEHLEAIVVDRLLNLLPFYLRTMFLTLKLLIGILGIKYSVFFWEKILFIVRRVCLFLFYDSSSICPNVCYQTCTFFRLTFVDSPSHCFTNLAPEMSVWWPQTRLETVTRDGVIQPG